MSIYIYICIYIFLYDTLGELKTFGVGWSWEIGAKVITLVSYSPLLVMQLVDYWSQSLGVLEMVLGSGDLTEIQ